MTNFRTVVSWILNDLSSCAIRNEHLKPKMVAKFIIGCFPTSLMEHNFRMHAHAVLHQCFTNALVILSPASATQTSSSTMTECFTCATCPIIAASRQRLCNAAVNPRVVPQATILRSTFGCKCSIRAQMYLKLSARAFWLFI